jgi:hypothetical protein
VLLGSFLSSVRKYKGRYWHVWYETDDEGNVEVVLCHKKYHLLLHPEEFSDLVESINKASYGILGKKGLLMDDSDHKKDS